MDLLETPLTRALNRLLDTEPWARERLLPFAGESVELRAPPLPMLRVIIAGDGTVRPHAERAAPAALTLTLKPGALAALARGPAHAMQEVDVAGNARLAAEVLFLARHLRWDVEESLSHVLGDVLAHRVVGEARQFAQAAADAGGRILAAVMEYAVDERRLLVRRAEADALASDNARLRDDLARLEQRLDRLAGGTRG